MITDPRVASRHNPVITAVGLTLLALVTVVPLLLAAWPMMDLAPLPSVALRGVAKAGVLLVLGLVLLARASFDRRTERHPFALALLFLGLAEGMTGMHLDIVDSDLRRVDWQRDVIYPDVLNHVGGQVPHSYRPLPYGFVRLIEVLTHDWLFAVVVYRWFFTWWFLWASYRLARRYHGPVMSLGVVVPIVLLYPASIWYYWGQLADPLSHALFILSVLYALENRPVAFIASLALGVAAKETVVLMVVAYVACRGRLSPRTVAVALGAGLACMAAYLAVRLAACWRPGFANVNGLDALMIGTNLGIGEPIAFTTVPLWMNYFHPLLFIGPFVPPIVAQYRQIDPALRRVVFSLVPPLLASNLCFGWLYESRNYMPAVPLLGTAALPFSRRTSLAPEPAP